MRIPEIITAKEAVKHIEDGSTMAIIAMTQVSMCTAIVKEIERSFLEEGHPRDLTYLHTCGQASAGKPGGMQHIAHEGLQPAPGPDGEHVPQHGAAGTGKTEQGRNRYIH